MSNCWLAVPPLIETGNTEGEVGFLEQEGEFSFKHIQFEMPTRFNRHLDIYIWSFEDKAGLEINLWEISAKNDH